MNVLVTGATGFVGRALVDRLAPDPDFTVRAAVRNLKAGFHSSLVKVAAPHLESDGDWRGAVAGIDSVIHLAARVHVMTDDAADPLAEYRSVNVRGTLRLARQAADAGVRRFIFVSTVKVNGESTPVGRPFTEADPPAPSDPYGVSKAEAEDGLFDLAKLSSMEIVVVRPTLVYGPGVKANFLTMTRFLRRGLPLPLGGLDKNRRSLIGIDNLVDLLATSLRHPAAANQVFLASDGEDLSTTELLRRTADALGIRPALIPIPAGLLRTAAMLTGQAGVWQRLGGNLQVDITKARRLLGWEPPVTVDEGLRRAVRTPPRTTPATEGAEAT